MLDNRSSADVTVVRWPAESDRRDRLRQDGRPRLLLVDEGHAPPHADDCLEDWVQLPASDPELQVRMETLSVRAGAHLVALPHLDSDGVLRYGGSWVSIPPIEATLTQALIGRFGAVVGRDALSKAAWPDGGPGRNALDVHVLRLRRRIAGLGLSIKTIRSRGYLMEERRGMVPPWPADSSTPLLAPQAEGLDPLDGRVQSPG